jgi:cellobiose phosphorylase
MIAGPDAPTYGEAKNSWLTGTAAWNYVAASQWIVGIRPELDGLRIDPRFPAGWGEIRITRRFRGATYRIVVHPAGATGGRESLVGRLVVDGQPIAGNLAPLPAVPGVDVHVDAYLEVPAEARS